MKLVESSFLFLLSFIAGSIVQAAKSVARRSPLVSVSSLEPPAHLKLLYNEFSLHGPPLSMLETPRKDLVGSLAEHL